jgi:phage-related protein
MVRKIIFYEGYFSSFYFDQTEDVQEKIDFVLDLISNVERVPVKFLKYLESTDGLYEIRVKVGSNIYRIFCFFDEGKLVVLLNGFQKKTEKTPKKELNQAEKIKKKYFKEKEEGLR